MRNSAPAPAMPLPSSSPPRIAILVDDDPDVLSALAFAFDVEGFAVRAYADAETLLNEPAPPEHCCLVVDQKLPGVDGLGLIRRLRERGCRAPAVLITTPTPAVIARAAKAAVLIVEKPLLCDTLVDTCRDLIANQDR
jgi:two-component system response regulator FixJ